MTINFIHVRIHDEPLEEGEDDYLCPHGGATIAYTVSQNGVDNNVHVKYAVAECAETDHYVKRIGRDIATSRLLAGDLMGEVTLDIDWVEDIEWFILNEYCDYKADYWDGNVHRWWYPIHPGWSDEAESERVKAINPPPRKDEIIVNESKV